MNPNKRRFFINLLGTVVLFEHGNMCPPPLPPSPAHCLGWAPSSPPRPPARASSPLQRPAGERAAPPWRAPLRRGAGEPRAGELGVAERPRRRWRPWASAGGMLGSNGRRRAPRHVAGRERPRPRQLWRAGIPPQRCRSV